MLQRIYGVCFYSQEDLDNYINELEEAKQNLMYEKETELSRGGGTVLSSMDCEEYM